MGKSTISMAMFNSFLYVYQAGYQWFLSSTFGIIEKNAHPMLAEKVPANIAVICFMRSEAVVIRIGGWIYPSVLCV